MNKYKKNLRELFLISAKRDIEKWGVSNSGNKYYSPNYNDYYFTIDIDKKIITISDSEEIISRYALNIVFVDVFVPLDFNVWLSVRRIKKYDKKKIKQQNIENKNKFLIDSYQNMKVDFIKEIRKEKLKKLE